MSEGERAEIGDCAISVHYASVDDLAGRLRIDHADPVVLMSEELYDELVSGNHHPDCEIKDGLFTTRGMNRTVVYRIGEYDPQRRAYLLTRVD